MAETEEATQARPPDRGVARRQAFLRAAHQVFLEQGYDAANINDIVRIAGGSLATLYSQFTNKEGLFLAVAQDQLERRIAAMTPPCVDHMSLEQGLQAIGERFLAAMMDSDAISFYRLVVGECRKYPSLMQDYLLNASDRIRSIVVAHLRRAAPEIENPEQIAGYFLEMVRSRHLYRALANQAHGLPESELSAHVAAAAQFLLRGARRT